MSKQYPERIAFSSLATLKQLPSSFFLSTASLQAIEPSEVAAAFNEFQETGKLRELPDPVPTIVLSVALPKVKTHNVPISREAATKLRDWLDAWLNADSGAPVPSMRCGTCGATSTCGPCRDTKRKES